MLFVVIVYMILMTDTELAVSEIDSCSTKTSSLCLNKTSKAASKMLVLPDTVSQRHCAYWCLERDCYLWSFEDNSCTLAFAASDADTYSSETCASGFGKIPTELGIVAFWPLTKLLQEKNAGLMGEELNAVGMENISYTETAVVFTSSSNWFNISSITKLDLQEFTFTAWIKPSANVMPIFECCNLQTGIKTTLWLYSTATQLFYRLYGSTSNSVITEYGPSVIVSNNWNFVAFSGTNTSVKLYLNSSQVFVNDTINVQGVKLTHDCFLGGTTYSRTTVNDKFIGQYKCATFHNRVLNSFEIKKVEKLCQQEIPVQSTNSGRTTDDDGGTLFNPYV